MHVAAHVLHFFVSFIKIPLTWRILIIFIADSGEKLACKMGWMVVNSPSIEFIFVFFILLNHNLSNHVVINYLEVRIGKDDLRLKLMRKSSSRHDQRNGDNKRQIDLREKLSKTAQPPVNNVSLKQRIPEARETSMLGRIPSARSSDDLMRMETMRRSYSPWTSDRVRHRSPDGFPSTSRGISPQRNMEDLQRRPLNRTFDSVRAVPYVTRDVVETSRPPSTAPSSFITHSKMSSLPPVTAKPVAPQLGQLPPPRTAAQRTSYMVNFP